MVVFIANGRHGYIVLRRRFLILFRCHFRLHLPLFAGITRAAPVPDIIPSPERNKFLREELGVVQSVADDMDALLK